MTDLRRWLNQRCTGCKHPRHRHKTGACEVKMRGEFMAHGRRGNRYARIRCKCERFTEMGS